jgi:hypothetical protein
MCPLYRISELDSFIALKSVFAGNIQGDSLEVSIFWEVIISVVMSKDLHMNMGLILHDYRDTAV